MAESFFDRVHKGDLHTPDVLSCLANLSNDEVFTPPEVVNQMLDLLPQELFRDPNTKFLDPACKTGVFLREIAKRLLAGLEEQIPDLQERIDHIFHEQLYGIAITELTSLLSRRSLYCSKYPNGQYSITHFDNAEGNIRYRRIQHTWEGPIRYNQKNEREDRKCKYCGASEKQWKREEGLETHAYEFIHTVQPEEILNMKFDVIISNPPYQMSDGGGTGSSAVPLYNKFVEQSLKLMPRYLTMIIPARWFAGGKGLDDFRAMMLKNRNIRYLTDYFNAADCFPGVDISGGVCYFLWDRDYKGDCTVSSIFNGNSTKMSRPLLEQAEDTFIRFNEAVSIVRKIAAFKEKSIIELVSPRRPFGIEANDKLYEHSSANLLKVYSYPKDCFISRSCIRNNQDAVGQYKVFIAKAYGERGAFPYLVTAKPFIGEPDSVCTETYLMIGPSNHKDKVENIKSYITTRFFRFLVLLKKNTQNAARGVYQLVPQQDFSETWTDEKLYKKYGITDDEVRFIESLIRPMDLPGGDD